MSYGVFRNPSREHVMIASLAPFHVDERPTVVRIAPSDALVTVGPIIWDRWTFAFEHEPAGDAGLR